MYQLMKLIIMVMNLVLITNDSSCGENREIYDGTNGDYLSRLYIIKAK